MSTFRVRITNESTGRWKELIVAASNDTTMFDSIYDHHELKTNHVRKWNSDLTRGVKSGDLEICVEVLNGQSSRPVESYSIERMKNTSTMELRRFADDYGAIVNLLLRCQQIESKEVIESKSKAALPQRRYSGAGNRSKDHDPTVSPMSSHDFLTSQSSDPELKRQLRNPLTCEESVDTLQPSIESGKSNSTVRVRIENEKTGRSKDLLVKVDDKVNLYDAIYNHNDVKSANVRKWGAEIAKAVKSKKAEIKCLLWDETIQQPYHSFSIEALKKTSTKRLLDLSAEPTGVVKLVLRCDDKSTSVNLPEDEPILPSASSIDRRNSSGSFDSFADDLASVKSRSLLELDLLVQEKRETRSVYSASLDGSLHQKAQTSLDDSLHRKETFRVRVINHISKRHKDLIVDVRNDLTVHDAIYNNHGVKRANVRKWSSDVVRDVKKGILEVQMHVWDPELDSARRIYTTKELATLSTEQLLEICPVTDDPIELRLVCVRTSKEDQRSKMYASRTSLSTLGTDSDLNSSKSPTPAVSMPARHMSLAHMSNISLLTTGMDRTNSKKKAPISALDLTDHSGILKLRTAKKSTGDMDISISSMSGHKNASWGSPKNSKTKGKQLFSSQLQDSLMLMKNSVQKSVTAIEEDFRNLEWGMNSSGLNSYGSLPSDDIEKKKERFLQLSNTPGGNSDGKSSRRKPIRRGRDSLLRQLVQNKDKSLRNLTDPLATAAFNRADQTKKLWKLCHSKLIVDKEDKEETELSGYQELREEGPGISPLGSPTPTFPSSMMKDAEVGKLGDSNMQNSFSSSDRLKRFLSKSSEDFVPPIQSKLAKQPNPDAPPLTEISVVTNGLTNQPNIPIAPAAPSGISLSPDVVKDVFPYHVVLDHTFRILQVGNRLSHLFRSEDEDEPPLNFIGKVVSDVLMCTGPVPMYGKWDWSVVDKMTDKTLYFESVLTNSTRTKANLKGTIIQVSESPRQIMLALLPNVKNLTELSNMDLSMGDLPLHSCQRDAVLLGEHSASEVKLTNHLDKLHRGLIDSMEQQIKDRTAELAMANESLEQANRQIQQQSARQLEHFACMSHEIRTPLNCIVGMSSILLEETHAKVDPPHAESIQMIYTSAELLRAVVDDVLDYAKLESGSFEVDITRIDLQESLASVVHSISQKIQEKNTRLRVHFSPDLPRYTETDSRRLQQVLFNLLGNAGKFSKRNSVIDLSVTLIRRNNTTGTKRDSRDEAIVDLDTIDILRFSVKDYGKGIEKKDFKTIFQPFSQASKQTATIYGGTGLGLSITSKLVKRLGGRISLDSEAERFTEFVVELPFDGDHVVEKTIQEKMKDVLIVVVNPTDTYDYSFTTYPIVGEPDAFGQETMNFYGTRSVSVANLEALVEQSEQLKNGNPDCHFALLVNENLFDARLLNQVTSDFGPDRCTTMTFGPKYIVESTKNAHVKSIRGVFPCILLDFISQNVSRTKEKSSKLEENNSSAMVESSGQSGEKISAETGSTHKKEMTETTVQEPEAKTNEKGLNDLKVLYAEDNKINQKVLTRVLNRVGIMDVTIVDDGLKAVNISETTVFDIIFMDMQMPVMDGIEACNLIVERDKEAKVVFVTAHALDEFKHKAQAAGGAGFISKPFRVEDIKQILRQFGFH